MEGKGGMLKDWLHQLTEDIENVKRARKRTRNRPQFNERQ